MTLFAFLAIPLWYAFLFIRYQFSLFPNRYVRGPIFFGALWFGLWLLLRIVFPGLFTPTLYNTAVYSQAGIVHTLVPMVVMLGWTLIRFRNDLKYRRSRGLFPFLAGMYASFFFLNSFLDLLVFPYPGVMSRDFFLPIYRMTMIFLVPLTVKKWFSWQPVHRMLLLVCTGAAMFIGPVPVLLEFLRLEGAGVISVFFLIGVALFGVEIPRILPNLVAPIQKFLRLGMGVLRHRWAVLVRR